MPIHSVTVIGVGFLPYISPKVNVTMYLKFKQASYDVIVQHVRMSWKELASVLFNVLSNIYIYIYIYIYIFLLEKKRKRK